mmetsp:Transcript_53715/g.143695  ORF Transcript_53715/g.143695 Transcript_53715/m.143695 type:complete len:175 (+) Transcript_53715:366-890(+)
MSAGRWTAICGCWCPWLTRCCPWRLRLVRCTSSRNRSTSSERLQSERNNQFLINTFKIDLAQKFPVRTKSKRKLHDAMTNGELSAFVGIGIGIPDPCETEAWTKVCKFVPEPCLESLLSQLQCVAAWLPEMCKAESHFNVSFRHSSASLRSTRLSAVGSGDDLSFSLASEFSAV